MKKLLSFALLLTACVSTSTPPIAPRSKAMPSTPAAIPYSVTLQGFSISGFPGVHSAVVAGTPQQLVIVGGRRNGLHGFPSGKTAAAGPSFPKTEANDTVFVLDLTNQKLLGSASISSLPAKVQSQFKSSNAQYQLLNGWLYILGGYGPDPTLGTLTTLGYTTVVDFNALVNAVTTNQPLDAAFASANIVQFDHPALALTGGELELLGNSFVLAFGQNYAGEYTTGGGLVNQIYADGVRIFQFTYPSGSAKPSGINFVAAVPDPTQVQQTPDSPFHRRDYTLRASIDGSGNRRLAAYGGVFKGGRMEGFLNPVFISPSGNTVTLTPNDTNQLLSQYATAAIQLYAKSSQMMYTTFFGGISQYYWSNGLKRDAVDLAAGVDGLPFINSVSTLAMSTTSDTGNQYVHSGETFPPSSSVPSCAGTAANYGGAEAAFVTASGVAEATDGVIDLDGVTSSRVVGYFVGGIAATAPYASSKGASCASANFYAVTLNPSTPSNTVELVLP